MKNEGKTDRFDAYLAETLQDSVKTTGQLAEENFQLWQEEQGGRTLIPFPSMVLVGIGLAACLVLGLFFFAQGEQPSLRLDVAQISLLTRRGAGDDAQRIRETLEQRWGGIQELYDRKTEQLEDPLRWEVHFHLAEHVDYVEVLVYASAVDSGDRKFRLVERYDNLAAYEKGLITLETKVVANLLDESLKMNR